MQNQTPIFFSKTALTIVLVFALKLVLNMIFQKNLRPRYGQKIAEIKVFVYFLGFASLVFLDFAHNDRWV